MDDDFPPGPPAPLLDMVDDALSPLQESTMEEHDTPNQLPSTMLVPTKEEMESLSPPYAAAPPPNPFTPPNGNSRANSSAGEDTSDDDDDIESLRSKACALASAKVPDYSDMFERKNKKYKTKKYRDKALSRARKDKDPNSIVLANKTSNILSEFQDYIHNIEESESPLGAKDILVAEDERMGRRASNESAAKSDDGTGVVAREWSYDGYSPTNGNGGTVKHRNLHVSNGNDDVTEDDTRSTHSSSKEWRGFDPGMLARGQKYTHPLLHSRRVKLGVLNCVLVSVIALSVSLAVNKKSSQAGNELGAKIEDVEEEIMGGKYDDPDFALPHEVLEPTGGLSDPALSAGMIENVRQKYNPKWFSRATGWDGATYAESIDFCASQGMMLCPYEAMCPAGSGHALYDGASVASNGQSKEQWAAVSNDVNDWIQVGPYDTCVPIQELHENAPEWGVTGKGSEMITQHVLCCSGSGSKGGGQGGTAPQMDKPEVPTASDAGGPPFDVPPFDVPPSKGTNQQAYAASLETFHPIQFDRSKGWEGTTYAAAAAFCDTLGADHTGASHVDAHGAKYALCPYRAICPLGPKTEPLGGYKDNVPGSTWAALWGETVDWVQLSQKDGNPCVAYSMEHPGEAEPEWETDATANLICCLAPESPAFSSASELTNVLEAAEEGDVPYDVVPAGESSEEEEEKEAIVADVAEFEPKMYDRGSGWKGKTYLEAIEFCAREEGYMICPYPAICPMGQSMEPLGGYEEGGADGIWAPLSDEPNGWVHLSKDNGCARYSVLNDGPPEWGNTGEGSEGITTTIMCCKGSILQSSEEGYMYEQAAEKYRPSWYDRSDGWLGTQYEEAISFCLSKGTELCPYEAYCPMAEYDGPLGGVKDEPNGSWAPMANDRDAWISVGPGDKTCKLFGEENGKPVVWHPDGGDEEELTRHIMCCEVGVVGVEEVQESATDVEAGPASPKPPFAETHALTEQEKEAYTATLEKFRPVEFDRSKGWTGTTHDDAVQFCAGHEEYELCHYHAVCPLGPGSQPLNGYKEHIPGSNNNLGSVWAPVVAHSGAEWAQLSNENQDSCKKYSAEHPESPKPDWGAQGDEGAKATATVICCLSPEAQVDDGASEAAPGATAIMSDQEESVYASALQKYHPIEFNREKGWAGKTYVAAVEFCEGLGGEGSIVHVNGAKYEVCPYEAICPLGHDTQPLGGYKENVPGSTWMPIKEEANAWAQISKENACIKYDSEKPADPQWGMTGDEDPEMTANLMCCLSLDGDGSGPAAAAVYESDVFKYEPVKFDRTQGWKGKTYLEAIEFCAREEGYAICPYGAICPLGPNTEPLGGPVDSSESWVPLSDFSNGWASLSKGNMCNTYADVHDSAPEWGMTGEGDEEVTHSIICCKGSVFGSAEETFLYKTTAKKYRPVWYDRADGYTGQTYPAATSYCQSKGAKLCPYEAYCPMADLDIPMGGIKDEPNGSWAPVSDVTNSWISLGSKDACKLYDIVNGEEPTWGITGEGNEELTRHVMCCDEDGGSVVNEVTATSEPSKEPTPPPTPAPSKKPTLTPTPPPTPPPTPKPSEKPTAPPTPPAIPAVGSGITDADASVQRYNPVWYDRSSGWTGQDYDAAFSFCAKQGPGYDLCPYHAYCPMGTSGVPFGGTKNEPDGSWAPVNDKFNEWVRVSNDDRCNTYSAMNDRHPGWGLTGEGNEGITRHIMCCQLDDLEGDTPATFNIVKESDIQEKYAPQWYRRDEAAEKGWVGKTYQDAIAFCASQDSQIPCPYEAVCPKGPGGTPFEGSRQAAEAWAPIMDIQNGWVNVGSSTDSSCEMYTSKYPQPPLWGLVGRQFEESDDADIKEMTAEIMCCKEPPAGDKTSALQSTVSVPVPIADTKHEQDILDKKHPIWYSRKDGYKGSTYEEAEEFCKGIGDMVLCEREAYCPEDSDKPLFLQKDAFDGEQWAPVTTSDGRANHKWILVGSLDGDGQSTCATFDDVKGMKPAGWDVDGAPPEVKENVMCCLNPNHLLKEINFAKDLDRMWLGQSFGWDGGSHAEAMQYCTKLGNKQLCPYAAYCPHGPGQPVIGGHVEDFNLEGPQWAPVHHDTPYWVQIGRKYDNSATTCMDNWELEGEIPSWSDSTERSDLKKHIMCCDL